MSALFPEPSSSIVCAACGRESEVERIIRPGEVKYKPCADCGPVGIQRQGDLYQRPALKKPNREPYHQSRYHGGRLG